MVDALYYAGFGVSDREASNMKDRAYLTLKDREWYLKKAIDKRTDEQYKFVYSVESVKFEVDIDEFEKIPIQKLKSANKELDIINYYPEKGVIHVKGRLPLELKYPDKNGKIVSYKISDSDVIETTLMDIQAYVESEEEKKSSDEVTEKILTLLYSESGSVKDGKDSLKVRSTNEKKETLTLQGYPKNWILEIKADVYQLLKQKESIQKLLAMPHPYHRPLINLLLKREHALWTDMSNKKVKKWNFLKDYDGSDEQKRFVETALNSPDFSILVGPPGSGKTATLIELISQLIAEGKRILLVASTHIAVDNVLERITEKSLNEKLGIIPIRIGREEAVSEKASEYRFESIVRSEKNRWLKKLETISSQGKFEPYEEELYQSLKGNDGDTVIKNVILDTSNLVCGTTFGILQAPMIKNKDSHLPPFDVMILDEASKTTFQEFLIPALHAKKWVISGDPKQLAPYVNSDFLSNSLRFICEELKFNSELKSICLDVFNSRSRFGDESPKSLSCKVVVLNEDYPYFDQIRKQIQYLEKLNELPLMVVIDELPIPESTIQKILVSKVVFVKQSLFNQIQNFLPPFSEITGIKDISISNSWYYQRYYFEKNGWNMSDGSDKEWEEEIVWRLSRMYEMKSSEYEQKFNQLKNDIELLLPEFNIDENNCKGKLNKSILDIQKMEIPSIIDLLIHGFGNNDEKSKNVIQHAGLPEDILENRLVELSYQHRMNPEISAFPRENIYEKKALNDGTEVKKRKICEIGNYSSHSFIRDCTRKEKDGNVNKSEAEAIMGELQTIKKWAKEHPKKDGSPWSVAILTFYRKQEMHLVNLMREEYNGSKNFYLVDFNLEVTVANVDRFQGNEADIVLLSFVRSGKRVGFLDNRNRLNVAITRARHYLIVFADKSSYTKRKDILGKFIQSLKEPIQWR
ncbi:AAA domain-containing protein [Methanolapillus millepedarum]|uniref:RecBCD enzyme subunit RecD n=1 Tax=Methanolapillus millepedarum TaxID=3028296 RepID=A0AA96ZU31_9EURY|nr:RecBCD enzyme subunit RecD [Methanosarcinaceae archaeon Ac7]